MDFTKLFGAVKHWRAHFFYYRLMVFGRKYVVTPEMEQYLTDVDNLVKAPMKYLVNGDSLKDLQEMIARLAFAFIMQDEEMIVPEDEAQVIKASQASVVADAIGRYASFTCFINQNLTEKDFGRIYDAAQDYYEEYMPALFQDFAFEQEAWKEKFAGSLFIR